ncbi:hypothetical protein Ocin01_16077 [Orchesella cincta]|uniref:Uncharacterized protein n=1 Tax=Orchesella cincta TaxID=48709 RepID=A0A1D2MC75_ORCCI|nr:hypothetical protein Ocin01_16077 [Orchesella cincta]
MLLVLALTLVVALQTEGLRLSHAVVSGEGPGLKNGTRYIFTSFMDGSVVTVHSDGDVTTDTFTNSPQQIWLVVTHPLDPDALEFKQEVVPYNMLSGYEDPPDNPGVFPRPLGLADRGLVERIPAWNIRIRGRWCLQANGYGHSMDYDDCESYEAAWQLWQLQEVI